MPVVFFLGFEGFILFTVGVGEFESDIVEVGREEEGTSIFFSSLKKEERFCINISDGGIEVGYFIFEIDIKSAFMGHADLLDTFVVDLRLVILSHVAEGDGEMESGFEIRGIDGEGFFEGFTG